MSTVNSKFTVRSYAALKKVFASRDWISADMVDKDSYKSLFVMGNGTTVDVKDKEGNLVYQNANPSQVLRKTIYNLNANSEIAYNNPRNTQLLHDARTAEAAGADPEELGEAYNEYLNAIQLTFSVIENANGSTPRFSNGELVKGVVAMVTTDKGSLLTLEKVRAVEATRAAKTKVNLDDKLEGFLSAGGNDAILEDEVSTPAPEAAKPSELDALAAGKGKKGK